MIPITNGIPTQRNDTNSERIDQQFIAADGRLFDSIGLIEDARKILHCHRAILADTNKTWQEAFEKEQLLRQQCVLAYRFLVGQHKKAAIDLTDLTNKHTLLQQEHEDIQLKVRTYESTMQDGESGEPNPIEQTFKRVKQLEAKIAALELERSEMDETHQNALRNAADCIIAHQEKIKVLEDELLQYKPQSRAEGSTSGEVIPSAAFGKRPERQDDDESIVEGHTQAKKGRKRRHTKETLALE